MSTYVKKYTLFLTTNQNIQYKSILHTDKFYVYLRSKANIETYVGTIFGIFLDPDQQDKLVTKVDSQQALGLYQKNIIDHR